MNPWAALLNASSSNADEFGRLRVTFGEINRLAAQVIAELRAAEAAAAALPRWSPPAFWSQPSPPSSPRATVDRRRAWLAKRTARR